MAETMDSTTMETARGLSLLPLLLISVLLPVGSLWIEVRRAHAELERIAYFDELTGLLNRRATLERFQVELSRASRQSTELALVVFDIDHFKQVNDHHGHLIGDRVLKGVARNLAAAKRLEDIAGRLGGEEFVVIMNDITPEEAEEAANRLRRDIATGPIDGAPSSLRVTSSGGLAMFPSDATTWDGLFAAADRRLYRAKQEGRDRLVAPPLRRLIPEPSSASAAV
jgi:diguanylate cyclase (GGDEF)-like protein